RDGTHVAGLHAQTRIRDIARSPLAWAMALVFGAQSAQAYAQFGWFPAIMHDAGVSQARAGALLGVLSGVGVPITLLLPWLIRISRDRAWLPWLLASLTIAGYIGVLFAPVAAPWLWALLLGMGGGTFTWTLTMIGRRSRTTEVTGALSGFTQGMGYLMAGTGPLLTVILHDIAGNWTAPLVFLLSLAALMGVGGTYIVRPRTVEDDLERRGTFGAGEGTGGYSSGNQSLISRSAVWDESDPCTRFSRLDMDRSPRIVPAAAVRPSVAPLSSRTTATASSPSSTAATRGPDVTNSRNGG